MHQTDKFKRYALRLVNLGLTIFDFPEKCPACGSRNTNLRASTGDDFNCRCKTCGNLFYLSGRTGYTESILLLFKVVWIPVYAVCFTIMWFWSGIEIEKAKMR